jgi:Uma2 family endonuclease
VWIVDLQANSVHVFRSPLNAKYVYVETIQFERLAIAALPGAEIDLTSLAR